MAELKSETQGAVRVLTFDRPEARNALSQTLRAELRAALLAARDDGAVRAVVLTGSGKAFCAGLDLAELRQLRERSTAENRADTEALAALLELIYTFPKPVVAALNGHAVAGGAGLASVCDVVVMSEDARLGYTEARIGFVAALVGVYLVRQVGEKHARDLLLSARLVSAQEALAMGLANEVCAHEAVLERALTRARQLAENAPGSLELTKRLLAAVPGMGRAEALRFATEVNVLSRAGDDLKEGVSAFLEKREPAWRR